jgi:hypothetical protein
MPVTGARKPSGGNRGGWWAAMDAGALNRSAEEDAALLEEPSISHRRASRDSAHINQASVSSPSSSVLSRRSVKLDFGLTGTSLGRSVLEGISNDRKDQTDMSGMSLAPPTAAAH